VSGQVLAVRQNRSWDIFRWHGKPEHVARESWFIGTGLSAPPAMLAVQAAATAVLATRPSRRAAATLAWLGAMMVVGCLIENKVRSAIRAPGQDPVVTVSGGVTLALSVAMAVLGTRGARGAAFP
jgi:hypothetical protein